MKVKARGMDPEEGVDVMRRHVLALRASSYEDLRSLFDPRIDQVSGGSGATYEIETEAFWDEKAGRNIRVIARLDSAEGRRRTLKILDDFIMAPDGTFVGE